MSNNITGAHTPPREQEGEHLIRFFKSHLPWLLMMTAITIQSSMGSLRLPDLHFKLMDKLIHFVVFGILGFIMMRGFTLNPPRTRIPLYALVTGIGILFAASDEWHQTFVPGRVGDVWDWVADILGIIVFAALYINFTRFRSNSERIP